MNLTCSDDLGLAARLIHEFYDDCGYFGRNGSSDKYSRINADHNARIWINGEDCQQHLADSRAAHTTDKP